MYKCCIFDLDGTLVNSLKALAYTTNLMLESFGLTKLPEERYKMLVGNGYKVLVERALEEAGDTDLSYYNEALIKYKELFKEYCTYELKSYDGIKELIEKLKDNGIKCAVLTNKPHDRAIDNVNEVFPKGTFDVIFGQKEGIAIKPDKEPVQRLLRELKLKKEDCLYIGDTDVDMKTGKNSDIDTVGVTWGFREREELEKYEPKYIIDTPEEITKICHMEN